MNATSKTRIAIAGLGVAATHIHLPAFEKMQEIELVGGFDPVAPVQKFGFPRFDSVERLLIETQPDILVIAAPPDFHFDLCQAGLESGAHIFCEKPFMNNLDNARCVIGMAAQAGRQVVVNNQYRFMNIHSAAKQAIGGTDFGALQFISANQTFKVSSDTESGWRGADPQRTCKEFGIHVFDLCRFFFGENPHTIHARMPKGARPDGPDFLNLIQLEFSGDRVAQITLDRLSTGPHNYLDMRLDGEYGIVDTHIGGNIRFSAGIRGGRRKPFIETDIAMGGRARLYQGDRYRTLATDPLDPFAQATRKLMRNYLDALANGTTPACVAADNIHSLALVFAAYESAQTGQKVTPDYGL